MEQPLPQFLDLQPKVAGPFTFKQILFIAGIGLIVLILFTQLPMGTFLIIALPLAGLALFLAFGKIRGFSAPTILARSFGFLFGSKIFIWRKTGEPSPEFIQKAVAPEKKLVDRPEASLKLAPKSKLKNLSNLVELRK